MKPFRLSIWALIVAGGLTLAQIPPTLGVVLMVFGAPIITGLLYHVALISLLFESIFRIVPRGWALLPLIAYGGYYAAYFTEPMLLASKEATLLRGNPPAIKFDGSRYSLKDDDALEVADRYDAPSAYQYYGEGRWVVHFLIPSDKCEGLDGNAAGINVRDLGQSSFHGACHISLRREPDLPVMSVKRSFVNEGSLKDQEEYTDVRIDGQVRAHYVTLHTTRLPSLPIIISGCILSDSSSGWQCEVNFARKRVVLNPLPGSDDHRFGYLQLIGLHEYKGADRFRNFHGYPENATLMKLVEQAQEGRTPPP